jgi:hypothetical protein
MTKRLKRIAPVKFGIVIGIFYGLISLIFVPFFLLFAGLSLVLPHPQPGASAQALPFAMSVVLAILLPVFYAVFGGLFGMLGAWIYNVIASWVGGIEFEVE